VLYCSDDKSLDKITRKKTQIGHASQISDKAKHVKLADKYSNIRGLLTDPPVKWSKEEIIGYVRWSFAVCINLFGTEGGEKLDNLLRELYAEHSIFGVTDDQLEEYYLVIHNSE